MTKTFLNTVNDFFSLVGMLTLFTGIVAGITLTVYGIRYFYRLKKGLSNDM